MFVFSPKTSILFYNSIIFVYCEYNESKTIKNESQSYLGTTHLLTITFNDYTYILNNIYKDERKKYLFIYFLCVK